MADVSAIIQGPALSTTPTAVPSLAPVTPAPRARIYRGDYTSSPNIDIRLVKPGVPNKAAWYFPNTNNVSPSSGWSDTVGFRYSANVNNTEVYVAAWDNTGGITLTTPAGFTLAATRVQGSLTMSAFYRTAPASPSTPAFSFSGVTNVTLLYAEYVGLPNSSQLDIAVVNGSTFASAVSVTLSATSGTLAQTNEMLMAVTAVKPSGQMDVTANVLAVPKGYTLALQSPGFSVADISLQHHNTNATTSTVFSAQVPSRDGNPHSGDAIVLLLGWKAGLTTQRFAPLGELDLCGGTFTARTYDLGEMSLRVPLIDPMASAIQENVFIECWVPDYPDAVNVNRAPYALATYVVRHIEDDDATLPRNKIVQGTDLRALIGDRPVTDAIANGTPATGSNAEDWVRYLVDKAGISVTDPNLKVYGLALESTNGHRGTFYPGAPIKAGATVAESITQIYRKDRLGWRFVLKNPGTDTATIEFQTIPETDRTFGKVGEAVFKASWDTAKKVNRIRDAVGAINYLTYLGPAVGAVRGTYTARDDASVAQWGLISGQVDGSTDLTANATGAQAVLAERLPKDYVEVIPRNTNYCRLGQHYNLNDRVTALTEDGTRYDGNIVTLTMNMELASSSISFGPWMDPKNFLLPAPQQPPTKDYQLFTFELGDTPAAAPDGGRDRLPAQLRKYTHLEGLTAQTYQINSAGAYASGTPGITPQGKTWIPDANRRVDLVRTDTAEATYASATTFAGTYAITYTLDAPTLKKAGQTITPTAPELNRAGGVTPGQWANGLNVVPDASTGFMNTGKFTDLRAQSGAYGSVADGATYNPSYPSSITVPTVDLTDVQRAVRQVIDALKYNRGLPP